MIRQFENRATDKNDPDIDEAVRSELIEANITCIKLPSYMNTEVKTRYIGILNGFMFYRSWRYWRCIGLMPIEMAERLYNDNKDLLIRAGGHCCNPDPKTMCVTIDSKKFINTYHIDTQAGLNRLSEFIRSNRIQTDYYDF